MKNRILMATLPVLACFAFLPGAQGQLNPPPDGCYPNFTTVEGCNALNFLTTGAGNTGVGWYALFSNSDGSFNTAVGAGALVLNDGSSNTAVGAVALLLNTTGAENTAVGANALVNNTVGGENTADGTSALQSNTEGNDNTAIGRQALFSNTIGGSNTAIGEAALFNNTQGGVNTAVGVNALENNTTGNRNTATGLGALGGNAAGNDNTATGHEALEFNLSSSNTAVGSGALSENTTGSNNTALGYQAGLNAGGSNNVYIGAGIEGFASDDSVCRIGSIYGATITNGTEVFVNSDNRLGTITSSKRFKQNITPTRRASEVLYELQPVTFQYKKEIDPEGRRQFGLVAEDVEKVNPGLVVHDKEGKPYTVRYEQVNAMLLNEFLKEHKKVQEQQASIAELKSTVTQQQKGMEVLTAQLKEQAAQIQKVSAELQLNKPAPQVVVNKP